MKLEWKPSKKIEEKAAKIVRLHSAGLTFQEIGKVIGHTRVYTNDLHSWYVRNIKHE